MALTPPKLRPPKPPKKDAEPAPTEPAPTEAAAPTTAPPEVKEKVAPKRAAPPSQKKAKDRAKAVANGEAPKVTSKRGRPESPKPKAAASAPKGPKPATENVVPEVPAIESEHFSGPQIEFGILLLSMKEISIANSKGKLEVRYVSPRAAVMLNKKLKVPARGCYTREDEVNTILDFYRKVPVEFIPTKWSRFLHPAAAPKAKVRKEVSAKAPKTQKAPKGSKASK